MTGQARREGAQGRGEAVRGTEAGQMRQEGAQETVAMLHTVPALAASLTELAKEARPDAKVLNFVDESLLQDTIAAGDPPPHVLRRLIAYATYAKESGAGVLLVTCSSIGEAAERARPYAELPVLRIDEPMAEEAVRTGARIGVLATLASTLGPTTRAVERAAARQGLVREVVPYLCEGAFEALRGGDPARHDTLVLDGFGKLAAQVDVVVLAQASMARIVGDAPAGAVPVLSSPRSGVAQLAHVTAGSRRPHGGDART